MLPQRRARWNHSTVDIYHTQLLRVFVPEKKIIKKFQFLNRFLSTCNNLKKKSKFYLKDSNSFSVTIRTESKISFGDDFVDTGNANVSAAYLPVGYYEWTLSPVCRWCRRRRRRRRWRRRCGCIEWLCLVDICVSIGQLIILFCWIPRLALSQFTCIVLLKIAWSVWEMLLWLVASYSGWLYWLLWWFIFSFSFSSIILLYLILFIIRCHIVNI